jgi:pyridinium-3,5-biscarboxylic acid mononucleotide sulfurtransferase
MTDLKALHEHLLGLGRVVLGYSGGVDSGFLAVAAVQSLGPERFLAVIGRSPSYPEVQAEAAVQLAHQFDIPLLQVHTNELQNPDYLKNSPDRCYFCKSELWTQLRSIREERGFDTIMDGTNADDLREHRPGRRAGREHEVRSPLAELGWTKQDIRTAARQLGLPTWAAPAAPCLSSRVRYGLEVTSERLRQVEEAEAFLRSLGVSGDLRVRHHGSKASVEVSPDQMCRLRSRWTAIDAEFANLGFEAVELDPAGYRRGALLSVVPQSGQ